MVDQAAALSVPKAYGDYCDLVRDAQIDVVHIAASNVHHYPAARAALLAGEHVVCEKPLAMTSAESAELVRLAEASGLVNAVTFNVRFYPVLQHARALVRRGIALSGTALAAALVPRSAPASIL